MSDSQGQPLNISTFYLILLILIQVSIESDLRISDSEKVKEIIELNPCMLKNENIFPINLYMYRFQGIVVNRKCLVSI